MKENAIRPGPLALALLVLALVFTAEMVLATLAEAGPYPRHDHWGMSENKRQYPHRRKDDYNDWIGERHFRKDRYTENQRPNLSDLDPTPEGEISLERVQTKRSQYLYDQWGEGDYLHEGKGWYDRQGEQDRGRYGLKYKHNWMGKDE